MVGCLQTPCWLLHLMVSGAGCNTQPRSAQIVMMRPRKGTAMHSSVSSVLILGTCVRAAAIIVAFRGTETQWQDILSDALAVIITWAPDFGGSAAVAYGFTQQHRV